MLSETVTLQFGDQPLLLLKEKALFLPLSNTLVLADVHLGKIEHLRKNGFALPFAVRKDYLAMNTLIERHQPEKIVFLGDLFHSRPNQSVKDFIQWRTAHASVQMILAEGNHDRFHKTLAQHCDIHIHPVYLDNGIRFLHDCADSHGQPTLSGHLHPGVQLRGAGKQQLILPCFYQHKNHLILPAFGQSTGLSVLQPVQGSSIHIITEEGIESFDGISKS